MECSHNCSTCSSTYFFKCPVCGANCIPVANETVANLTKKTIDNTKKHYLCTNSKCDVAYIDEELSNIYSTNDVKVPIWYKSDFFNYIVCYCRQIYLRDVIRAVFSLEDPTKDNIIKFLEKENVETNCLLNNPTGNSCDMLFENSIEYAIDLKKQQN